MRVLPLLSLGCIAAALACSSNPDAVGQQPSAVIVTPVGNDHPGSFAVAAAALPTGTSIWLTSRAWFGPSPLLDTTLDQDAPQVALDSNASFEQPVGTYCFAVGDEFGMAAKDCSVVISPNQTTTYGVGTLAVQNNPQEAGPVLGLDVGAASAPSTGTSTSDLGKTYVSVTTPTWSLPRALQYGVAVTGDTYVDFLPGQYELQFGLFDGFTFEMAGAAVSSVDLRSFATRRSLAIVAPTRSFPNAVCPPPYLVTPSVPIPGVPAWFVFGTKNGAERSSPAFVASDGEQVLLGENASDGSPAGSYLLAFGETYEDEGYVTNSNPSGLTFSGWGEGALAISANPGDPPAVTTIGRLDIDDVMVTQNDGSTADYPGTYVIQQQKGVDANGNAIWTNFGCSAPTKTGFDVPAGTYQVTTTYETLQDGNKTDVQTVTVP